MLHRLLYFTIICVSSLLPFSAPALTHSAPAISSEYNYQVFYSAAGVEGPRNDLVRGYCNGTL